MNRYAKFVVMVTGPKGPDARGISPTEAQSMRGRHTRKDWRVKEQGGEETGKAGRIRN